MSTLTIKHFIIRTQVMQLYRTCFKTAQTIRDATTRKDVEQQVRSEFERYRGESDLKKIEYLVVTGRKQLSMLEALSANQ